MSEKHLAAFQYELASPRIVVWTIVEALKRCQLAVMFACELPDVRAQQVKIARPNLLPITSFSATCRGLGLGASSPNKTWTGRRKHPRTEHIQARDPMKCPNPSCVCDAKHLQSARNRRQRLAICLLTNDRSLQVPVLHTMHEHDAS